jgi:DNA topoisomerase-1
VAGTPVEGAAGGETTLRVPSLRHSSDREPGYTRRRQGKGWRYLDSDGRTITDARLRARFDALVIPPAWTDVWICKSSRGHLQATGTDAAGRRQYRYHPKWHEQRQVEKYARILRFADGLPDLRRVTAGHLRRRTLDREKAMAAAVRLLDRTNIRLGGEAYAKQHRTYGLATLRSKHIEVEGDTLILDFTGKGGIDHHAEVRDARLAKVVAEMDELPGYEVFKYLDEAGDVVDVRSGDVNAYIKEQMGEDFSAKDFRTWAGTVAAAVALSEVGPLDGAKARQRAVTRVCRVAAELLGNTPAVCRASYIDPRVIDQFMDGTTIASIANEVESRMNSSSGGHSSEELAVLALLRRGLEDRAAAA